MFTVCEHIKLTKYERKQLDRAEELERKEIKKEGIKARRGKLAVTANNMRKQGSIKKQQAAIRREEKKKRNEDKQKKEQLFRGLYSFMEVFTHRKCLRYFTKIRWQKGVTCPHCKHTHIWHYEKVKNKADMHKCSECGKQFNVFTRTIFEGKKIPLRKWFMAIYLENACKGGITAGELAIHIEVCRNTAGMMLRKLREAGYNQSMFKFDVERERTAPREFAIDITVRDGKNKNRKKNKKRTKKEGGVNRVKVLVIIENGGYARTWIVPNESRKTLLAIILAVVPKGSIIHTDEAKAFASLTAEGYVHHTVNHSADEYGGTNIVEGFNSYMKAGFMNFRNNIPKKNAALFINAAVFRYNTHDLTEYEKFEWVIENIAMNLNPAKQNAVVVAMNAQQQVNTQQLSIAA